MEVYKLNPEKFLKAKLKDMVLRFIVVIFAMVSVILASYLKELKYLEWSLIEIVLGVCIIVLSTLYVIVKSLKIQKDLWLSYELVIDMDRIIKKEKNIKDIIIYKSEVSKIIERSGQGLFIQTIDKDRTINIPSDLTGYSEVKGHLLHWGNIDKGKSTLSTGVVGLIIMIAILPIFLGTFYSDNKYIVIATGGIFILILIFGLIYVQRNKNIDKKTRETSWKASIPAFIILYKVIEAALKK